MEAAFIVVTIDEAGVKQFVEIDTIYYHVPSKAIRLTGRKVQLSATYGDFEKPYTLTADNSIPVLVFDRTTGEPVMIEENGQQVQLVIGEFDARVEQLKPLIEPLVVGAIQRKETNSSEPLKHYR